VAVKVSAATSQSADHRNWSGSESLLRLGEVSRRLKSWLVEDAYPRWWQQGADRVHGGFHERLQQNAEPGNQPRRARLHPRQIYSFGVADDLGHDGLTALASRHALDYFLRHYIRSDQLVRASVAPDGRVVDDSVLLYDQAFALLGYASAFDVFNDESLRNRARQLLVHLRTRFENPAGGFREAPDQELPLTSNSHMHLFEAALAWMALDRDQRWRSLAGELVHLAQRRLMDPVTTQIREFFTPEWKPAVGVRGRIVEPGHQFEWAWLLLRWQALAHDASAGDTAVALIDIAESRGVDAVRGVAVNSLLDDGSIRDGRARLWPQAERLKAACLSWDRMRLSAYCDMALRAALALERYLQTTTPGLWRDTMTLDGGWIDEPAPASSLYHLVSAIAELDSMMNRLAMQTARPR
jgi:mannose/cellobiose epimerase-like protein (N-acyl-D-glucosamine 2-epimerase family)